MYQSIKPVSWSTLRSPRVASPDHIHPTCVLIYFLQADVRGETNTSTIAEIHIQIDRSITCIDIYVYIVRIYVFMHMFLFLSQRVNPDIYVYIVCIDIYLCICSYFSPRDECARRDQHEHRDS